MTKKETPSKKGKPKKLAVNRQSIQDLSPTKSAAQRVKGGRTALQDEGKYGVMASGC